MLKSNKKHTSQFFKDCNTDWNLNAEFLLWLNHWFKEYKENAGKIVDLEFHKHNIDGEEKTQLDIINRIIELTDDVNKDIFEIDKEIYEKNEKEVDEIFKLFHEVFWEMWW